jgi:putative SOS response-associated peptidase YedK
MCGRFTLHTPEARIRAEFGLQDTPPLGLVPRYNIAPGQDIPIIRAAGSGSSMRLARWGLVPHWSKEPKTRYSTINARIESVAGKPAYRTPFRRQRCLVPADGFYEWKVRDGKKVPYHVRMQDGGLFAFAGLWDHWGQGEAAFESCSIIVMPAGANLQPLHARMPALIAPEHYADWIDPGMTGTADILALLDSARSGRLRFHPVSDRVNSPRNDDEHCIE